MAGYGGRGDVETAVKEFHRDPDRRVLQIHVDYFEHVPFSAICTTAPISSQKLPNASFDGCEHSANGCGGGEGGRGWGSSGGASAGSRLPARGMRHHKEGVIVLLKCRVTRADSDVAATLSSSARTRSGMHECGDAGVQTMRAAIASHTMFKYCAEQAMQSIRRWCATWRRVASSPPMSPAEMSAYTTLGARAAQSALADLQLLRQLSPPVVEESVVVLRGGGEGVGVCSGGGACVCAAAAAARTAVVQQRAGRVGEAIGGCRGGACRTMPRASVSALSPLLLSGLTSWSSSIESCSSGSTGCSTDFFCSDHEAKEPARGEQGGLGPHVQNNLARFPAAALPSLSLKRADPLVEGVGACDQRSECAGRGGSNMHIAQNIQNSEWQHLTLSSSSRSGQDGRGSEVGVGKGQVCKVRGVGTDTADIEEKGAVGQHTDPGGGVSRSGGGGGGPGSSYAYLSSPAESWQQENSRHTHSHDSIFLACEHSSSSSAGHSLSSCSSTNHLLNLSASAPTFCTLSLSTSNLSTSNPASASFSSGAAKTQIDQCGAE